MYRSHAGDMGLVNLVAGYRQRVALPPLLQCLTWERNWVQTHGSVSRRAMNYVGSPYFLGAVPLSIIVDDFTKDCHVRELPTGSIHQVYVDWRGKHTYRIGRVFPCRVYIDSNHRDSWI
jgi:hypothetical protein